jgi:predicted phosphodiesterase
MKTIVIGDIHGEKWWKDILKKEVPDEVIFIGDYFDSFYISMVDQIINFNEIMNIEEDYGISKVIRLIGNHDFHYLYNKAECSGFNYDYKDQLYSLLESNKSKLQMAYEKDGVLFTHAGVTRTWCWNKDISEEASAEQISSEINRMFNDGDFKIFYFEIGYKFNRADGYGNNIYQGPLWVRPYSLCRDKVSPIQVVGHTKMLGIKEENGVYFIDTNGKEYLKFENGNRIICKL